MNPWSLFLWWSLGTRVVGTEVGGRGPVRTGESDVGTTGTRVDGGRRGGVTGEETGRVLRPRGRTVPVSEGGVGGGSVDVGSVSGVAGKNNH